MAEQELPIPCWTLDSSTFINATLIQRVALIVSLRPPVRFPEYVFRFELGTNARETTRDEACSWVNRNQIGIENLTLADLDRIASLDAPRRVGVGEIACAVIAERHGGGVLCDDRKAKRWLVERTNPRSWDSIEEVLLDAAYSGHISEFDLVEFQRILEANRYRCRIESLRMEHLQRRMNQHCISSSS